MDRFRLWTGGGSGNRNSMESTLLLSKDMDVVDSESVSSSSVDWGGPESAKIKSNSGRQGPTACLSRIHISMDFATA